MPLAISPIAIGCVFDRVPLEPPMAFCSSAEGSQ